MPVPATASPAPPRGDAALVRAIGPAGATLLVIGNVIGSAIFLTSGVMAAELGSLSALLLAWVAGGALTVAGGLTFAEMGAMLPRSGGLYVFLEQAYGRLWGFLFGWTALLVTLTGAVAAVAVGFAEYFSYFVPGLGAGRVVVSAGPLQINATGVVAAASIVALAGVNYVGVQVASRVQGLLTVLKVLGLVAIPLLALAWHPATPRFDPVVPPVPAPWAAFGVAMIAVMWAFDGWYYLAFSAGEVRNPGRTLPRAFISGTLALTGIYLAVNLGYAFALGLDGMAGQVRVAERAMSALAGPGGATFIALTVCLSTLGCNVAGTIGMSRACFAMASDGLFFRSAAAVHPVYRTPHVAIVLTCAWSALLALSGAYDRLFTYVTFASVLFNMLAGLAIFRLRVTHPALPRPYRTWGYPYVPLLFVGGSALLVLNTLLERPVESLLGLGLVALGLPAYRHWVRTAHA